jgi:ferric-dicitrate binding protein FerR (iron transport regulator)
VSDIEDIDKRFNELTAQIDQNEQRKMNKAAAREWARLPHVRRRRNRRMAAFAVFAVVAGAGLLIVYRPEAVSMIPGVISSTGPRP